MDLTTLAGDLEAEQHSLDAIVAELRPHQWDLPTPSPGWSIADQIGHLAYFDEAAVTAITDPGTFGAHVARLLEAMQDGGDADDVTLSTFRRMEPEEILERWRVGRAALAAAAATLEDGARVPWYGPDMSAKSFLTARLMETWAHGQDVADAVGVERAPSDRLRHIARLGHLTRGWSYRNRGLEPPKADVQVVLAGPGGETWSFGPSDATESVSGSALDFCLVVTQRRHVDDTELTASEGARDWLLRAQAFAGPPTDGPPPGTRV